MSRALHIDQGRVFEQKMRAQHRCGACDGGSNLSHTLACGVIKEASTLINQAHADGIRHGHRNVGMLRQWLNEDRISDPKRMVTNADLLHWLNWETRGI